MKKEESNKDNEKNSWNRLIIAFPILVIIVLVILGEKLEISEVNIFGLVFKLEEDIFVTENGQYILKTNTPEVSLNVHQIKNITEEPAIPTIDNRLSKYENVTIGSKALETAYYSSGSEFYEISSYFRIQRIRLEEIPGGCSMSNWNSEFIWLTGKAGNSILINGEEIGRLYIDTGNHGYFIKQSILVNDEICIKSTDEADFSLIWGPDVLYHYDSYCNRGFCTGGT